MTGSPAHESRLRVWSGLCVFYVTLFAVLAVFMTFLPLWLQQVRRIGKQEVAWVLSASTVARTIAGPLWAQRVDRSGRSRRTLILLSIGSLLAFAAFGVVESVAGLMCCAFLFGCFYPPIHAIQDALSMRTARRLGFTYGRLRATGSLAFLATVLLVGFWLDRAPAATIYEVLVGCLLLMCCGSWLLPRDREEDGAAPDDDVAQGSPAAGNGSVAAAMAVSGAPPNAANAATVAKRGPILAVLASPQVLLLLVASALIQGSHSVYYTYSAIHWRAHGIAESTTGQLWAEGVLAEIALFFWARTGIERLRPTTMLVLGAALAAVRWFVIGSTTSVEILFLVNWLHAFSFGCTYLGALRALERRVPARQLATAQGLHGAVATGVGFVVAAVLGGYLFEQHSPRLAFYAMGALALGGGCLAFALRRRGIAAEKIDQANAPSRPQ